MSKFKRICSLLCSGMCMLGTNASANLNKGKKSSNFLKSVNKIDANKKVHLNENDPQVNLKNSKSDIRLGYGLDDFVNSQKKESEETRDKYWKFGGEAIIGARINGRTKHAHAVGALEVLNNPKFIEFLANLDLESIEKEARSKQISSNWLYAAKWIGYAVATGGGTLLNSVCHKAAINKNFEKLYELITNSNVYTKGTLKDVIEEFQTKIGDIDQYKLEFVSFIYDKLKTRPGIIFLPDEYGLLRDMDKIINGYALKIINFIVSFVSLVLGNGFNYFSQTHQGQSDMLRKISERIREINGGKVSAVEANQANSNKNVSVKNDNVKGVNKKDRNINKKVNRNNQKKINIDSLAL